MAYAPIHVGEILAEELAAREWKARDLAGGEEAIELGIEILLACADPEYENRGGCRMGTLVDVIATGLGTSREMWLKIEQKMIDFYVAQPAPEATAGV